MAKLMEIVEELNNRGINAEIKTVKKNNVDKQGIFIPVAEHGGMIMYEDIIEGDTLEEQVECIIKSASSPESQEFKTWDLGAITTKEYILDNVFGAVCNRNWNQEFLLDKFHGQVFDTDLEWYARVSMPGNDGSFSLDPALMAKLGISEDEVADAIKAKSAYKLMTMEEALGMPGMPGMGIYVATNKNGYHGASSINDLEFLRECMEKMGCDKVVIIPSSIHEILLVRESEKDTAESFRKMICEVNDGFVEESERLSDHPYIFDGETLMCA